MKSYMNTLNYKNKTSGNTPHSSYRADSNTLEISPILAEIKIITIIFEISGIQPTWKKFAVKIGGGRRPRGTL